MSRINYNEIDDIYSWLSAGRWEGRVKSVLKGKPAQKHFQRLEAALLALPEKRLISGYVCDHHGDVCALGALALYEGVDRSKLAATWRVENTDYEYPDYEQRAAQR